MRSLLEVVEIIAAGLAGWGPINGLGEKQIPQEVDFEVEYLNYQLQLMDGRIIF